jgi:competence ComEA-like helix-hairpin-helix protein
MESLKNYFYYTRAERAGALVLIFLCIIALALPQFIKTEAETNLNEFVEAENMAAQIAGITDFGDQTATEVKAVKAYWFDPNTAPFEILLDLGLPKRTAQSIINYRSKGGRFKSVEDLKKIYNMRQEDFQRLKNWVVIDGISRSVKKIAAPILMQRFDPNTASLDTLLALGLGANTAESILRYRQKGGKFRKPEDFGRIYNLSEADYERLLPYIQIAQMDSLVLKKQEGGQSFKSEPLARIDINKADEGMWQTLRGVGPGYAGKICRFREALGGFISVEQIGETKGLPDSTFQIILPLLDISPIFRPLAINTATVEELAAHPYLDYREATAIVAYRNQHGKFQSMKDFDKILALKPAKVEKIHPYLDFR